jgi:NhaP-type Na+/H+ or K+/H+ antiporter
MTFKPLRVSKKFQILIHGIGLSSLGSAILLQSTVFTSILQNGYFRGAESSTPILIVEIGLTGCAIAYFSYIALKFVFATR